jgi:hypothetical protein
MFTRPAGPLKGLDLHYKSAMQPPGLIVSCGRFKTPADTNDSLPTALGANVSAVVTVRLGRGLSLDCIEHLVYDRCGIGA